MEPLAPTALSSQEGDAFEVDWSTFGAQFNLPGSPSPGLDLYGPLELCDPLLPTAASDEALDAGLMGLCEQFESSSDAKSSSVSAAQECFHWNGADNVRLSDSLPQLPQTPPPHDGESSCSPPSPIEPTVMHPRACGDIIIVVPPHSWAPVQTGDSPAAQHSTLQSLQLLIMSIFRQVLGHTQYQLHEPCPNTPAGGQASRIMIANVRTEPPANRSHEACFHPPCSCSIAKVPSEARSTRKKKASPLSENSWDEHKDLIGRMYMKEGRTLQDLRDYMQANHSFDATERQYRSRLERWSYQKKRNRSRPLTKRRKKPDGLGPENLL